MVRNGLVTISTAAFTGLQHLQLLRIESNILCHAPDLRHVSHSLEFISLHTGRFKSIPQYFAGCSAIRHVFINNANMTDLFWGLASISVNVKELDFAQNKLKSLSPLYDVLFVKLERLQLFDNAINVINLKKLHFPVLKFFDIRKNYLIQLDDPSGLALGSMLTPESLTCLYIEGNPWNCNGTFNWLIKEYCNIGNSRHDLTFFSKSKTLTISEVERLVCENPPNKHGTRIIDDVTLCGRYPINVPQLHAGGVR